MSCASFVLLFITNLQKLATMKLVPHRSNRVYSTNSTQFPSVDELRASILTKCGLQNINNAKSYTSIYNWQPYDDILSSNNKMIHINKLKDKRLLHDISSVLTPLLKDFDLDRMRNYRLNRIRESLQNNNCDVGIFFDPTNIRYITDVPNMQIWIKGNPFRYVVVSADERDPILLYDFKAAEHLGTTLRPDIIQTVYKSKVPVYMIYGSQSTQQLPIFIQDLLQQIDDNFIELKSKNKGKINLAVDYHRTNVMMALFNEPRFNIIDAFGLAESARMIKNYDEYLCLKLSCQVANIASYRMREYLNENMSKDQIITDNEIFGILSGTNIEYGGESLECKLLGSGQRSNPWYQESSNYPIEPETLLSFDTDLIGPFGYCADFSRCYWTGNINNNDKPNDIKNFEYCKDLYNTAFEQVQYNMNLVKPGMSYKELSEKLWKCPDKYFDQRYTCVFHGVGSCDEWPTIMEQSDGFKCNDDEFIQPGTCLSVESYIGEVGGNVGVKLEDQIFVTEDGFEVISNFPYEEKLLI